MNWPLRLAQSVIPKRLHWFFHLKHSEVHGRARWMNGREMQAFLSAGHDGLALGLGRRLSCEESAKNLVLLAPTGSGKVSARSRGQHRRGGERREVGEWRAQGERLLAVEGLFRLDHSITPLAALVVAVVAVGTWATRVRRPSAASCPRRCRSAAG